MTQNGPYPDEALVRGMMAAETGHMTLIPRPASESCPHCGGQGHSLLMCPCVRAVEFYESGAIRRIELRDRDTH